MQEKRDIDNILTPLDEAEKTDLLHVWRIAGSVEEPGRVDTKRIESMKAGLMAGMSDARADRSPARNVRSIPFLHAVVPVSRFSIALAASVVVFAAAYLIWFRPVTITALPGQYASVVLDDGTRVQLNSGAALEYARGWGSTRRVTLKGEAFFDVVHSDEPFLVETFNATIQVYGTRFNVRAWNSGVDPSTDVYLERGSVSLKSVLSPGEPVMLVPGDSRSVSSSGLLSDKSVGGTVDTDWLRNDFEFRIEPLSDVLEEVERRFGTHIQTPGLSTGAIHITGSIKEPPTAESFLSDLSGMLNLTFRETSEGFELYHRSGQ